MSVEIVEDRIQETRAWFVGRAAELLGDSAEVAQEAARTEARRRSGELADSIEVEPSAAGLTQDVEAGAPYAVYNEFGTGIYAEGQSQAEEIPWVYYDEYLGQFFTTSGIRPAPFIRPGFERGKDYLLGNAKRYFAG